MQKGQITTLKYRFYLCVGWGTCSYTGSTGSFSRCLEVLEGTFKNTYEAKLFGMHVGSVLSGLYRKCEY